MFRNVFTRLADARGLSAILGAAPFLSSNRAHCGWEEYGGKPLKEQIPVAKLVAVPEPTGGDTGMYLARLKAAHDIVRERYSVWSQCISLDDPFHVSLARGRRFTRAGRFAVGGTVVGPSRRCLWTPLFASPGPESSRGFLL